MRLFRRNKEQDESGAAVLDRPQVKLPDRVDDDFAGTTDELFAEIERLTLENRSDPDRQRERELLRLRHLAGMRLLIETKDTPEHPEPDFENLPDAEVLPEIPAQDLTPGILRAGILRDGCVLVRGLIDRQAALDFAAQIDRAFAEREKAYEGQTPAPGYYDEFVAREPFEVDFGARVWVRAGGGVLAPDAPLLACEMLDLFDSAGVSRMVGDYLGEYPLLSLQKTTLRKATPDVPGAWHQDGKFMGEVRALNLWLSLSHCGDEAPGLDLVPRRLDHLVATETDEAVLPYQVSTAQAQQAAGDKPIIRPIFEPGDALFFDEMFLHQTASDPSMPNPRYAVESWFFGASAFPAEYGPIAA
jgi:hypothetical protein